MNSKYFKWLFEGIENKSKNLYILVGPPAVGKSTWIKDNFAGKQYKVISRDEIIEKIIYKHYGLTAAELYFNNSSSESQKALEELNIMFESIVMGVLDERPDNVIVDMMNADSKQRAKILDRVKQKYPEYKLIAVKFNFEGHEDKIIQADIKRAKERGGERKVIDPEYIINVMKRIKADPPTESEGFDEIQDYNRFKDPQKMNEYNHKQFIEWLDGQKEKHEEVIDKLLIESKLSEYWKKRAARRAKNAKRNWPNAIDRKWALQQQEKSTSLDKTIRTLFEKELEESQEMLEVINKVMRKIKKERKRIKMQREAAKAQTLDHPIDATAKRAKGKTLSKPNPKPKTSGVKKGFDIKRKSSNTPVIPMGAGYGGAGAAMEEGKEKNNENN